MKQLFLSHPFGGKKRNLDAAVYLAAALTHRLDGAIVVVPWVPLCRYWSDEGDVRARGLELLLACVEKCDGLIAVNPHMSEGGMREFERAREIGKRTSVVLGTSSDIENRLFDGALARAIAADFGVGVWGGK